MEIYFPHDEYFMPQRRSSRKIRSRSSSLSEDSRRVPERRSPQKAFQAAYRAIYQDYDTDEIPLPLLKPFHLYDPDGNPILPRVWSQIVEPGDLITMRFHDETLNGAGAHPVTLMQHGVAWVRSWWWSSGQKSASKRSARGLKDRFKFVRKRVESDGEDWSGSEVSSEEEDV